MYLTGRYDILDALTVNDVDLESMLGDLLKYRSIYPEDHVVATSARDLVRKLFIEISHRFLDTLGTVKMRQDKRMCFTQYVYILLKMGARQWSLALTNQATS